MHNDRAFVTVEIFPEEPYAFVWKMLVNIL